jgi:acylphosphatase
MPDSHHDKKTIRRTVYFTGRVQGVGFRYTAESIARGFRVVGYVRNLPDGRVELVTEGVGDEVEGFIASIEETMRPNIRERRIVDEPPTGEFNSFRIAF